MARCETARVVSRSPVAPPLMSRLYVGRLASRTRERDLEDAFGKYGKIRAIDLKFGFAFVVRFRLTARSHQ